MINLNRKVILMWFDCIKLFGFGISQKKYFGAKLMQSGKIQRKFFVSFLVCKREELILV